MLFPPAKLHGTISPELMKLWEMRCHAQQGQSKSQSPPLYEKVLIVSPEFKCIIFAYLLVATDVFFIAATITH